MTPIEIRKQIDFNNKLIKEALAPNVFSLNNTVFDLLKQNKDLQKQCQHQFGEDGYCVVCDYYKEDMEENNG